MAATPPASPPSPPLPPPPPPLGAHGSPELPPPPRRRRGAPPEPTNHTAISAEYSSTQPIMPPYPQNISQPNQSCRHNRGIFLNPTNHAAMTAEYCGCASVRVCRSSPHLRHDVGLHEHPPLGGQRPLRLPYHPGEEVRGGGHEHIRQRDAALLHEVHFHVLLAIQALHGGFRHAGGGFRHGEGGFSHRGGVRLIK
eukprot:462188-Prorocentrum_minimum.AAC.2